MVLLIKCQMEIMEFNVMILVVVKVMVVMMVCDEVGGGYCNGSIVILKPSTPPSILAS